MSALTGPKLQDDEKFALMKVSFNIHFYVIAVA
jgi:hypothetical protein